MSREREKIQPEPDTSGVHLWLVLWKAFTALQRVAQDDIASSGMCLSDFAVLEVLLHKGPLPVNTIAPKVSLTSGSISIAIDRLEARGLVERRNDPGDRRARVVHLTAAGRTWIGGAFERHAAAMEAAVEHLTRQDRLTLLRLLKKAGAAD